MHRRNGLLPLAIVALAIVVGRHGCECALGQVSSIEPTSPVAGDVVVVRYAPSASDARLAAASRRFAVLEIESAAGSTLLWSGLEMDAGGATESASFPLPPDAEFGTVRFYAHERFALADEPATVRFIASPPDGHGIAIGQPEEEIERRVAEHRANHPHDVTSIRAKWRALASGWTRDLVVDAIRADLAAMEAAGLRSADARSLRAAGLWMVGEREAALSIGEQLVIEAPASRDTDRALAAMADAHPGPDGARWTGLVRRVAEVAPAAECVRAGGLAALARDPSVPLALVDRCADVQRGLRPGDSRPLVEQIVARIARDEDMARIDGLASQAIEVTLAHDFRPSADPTGTLTEGLLRDILLLRSRVAERNGDGPVALLYAAAARGISPNDPGAAPEALDRGWSMVTGRPTRPPEGDASVASVPEPAGTTDAGDAIAAQPASGEPTMAFALRNMDGNEVRLEQFRGRVVVLNFWFVACKPCRMEMPKLNELVERFDGREVTFLGLCLDGADRVRESLGEGEFRYTTLVDATSATAEFRVRAYPTHVVIGRDGRVVLYRVGGGDADISAVSDAVEAALASQ